LKNIHLMKSDMINYKHVGKNVWYECIGKKVNEDIASLPEKKEFWSSINKIVSQFVVACVLP
jgi:hypothetical protein